MKHDRSRSTHIDIASLRSILPPHVAVAEAAGAPPAEALLPEEAACLGRVAQVRFDDFSRGRSCARAALKQLGLPPVPIVRGADREPLWPLGIVGSITHCRGYAAAAVARRERIATIGIDAEPHEKLPEGVLAMVALPSEAAWIAANPHTLMCFDRLLFSIKECVYKAWFPLTGRWLGFEDVCVTIEPESESFEARFLVAGPVIDGIAVPAFRGRYRADAARLLCAIAVENDAAGSIA